MKLHRFALSFDGSLEEPELQLHIQSEPKPVPLICSTPKMQLKSPEYTIYRDADIVVAAKSRSMPSELRHRLIRATISNMQAMAFSHPFNRKPTNAEVNEMAKSLTITYPCLNDPETGHVSNFRKCCL